ncbi:techylectin-5B-like isoform X2 [Zophobas morio]|uniref:techylectin-5B-like isoform X2 n=1 Tax=Zophobas morio TaxID=2755281 RepID=UPI00308367CA
MDLRIYLVTIALVSTLVNSQQNDDRQFVVMSSTETPLSSNLHDDQIFFDDQFELPRSFSEAEHRLNKFELKLSQVQRALEKMLEVHGAKVDQDDTTAPTSDISKIEEVVKDKLKLHKSCENISTQIETKLEEIKEHLLKKVVKAKFSTTELEKVKRDVITDVSSQLNSAKKHIFKLKKKLDFTNEKLDEVTKVVDDLEKNETTKVGEVVKNCGEVLRGGNATSGVYTIKPTGASKPFEVVCDMETKGGGWTYVLRRFNGSQDFYLNWTDYKNGFGHLDEEFWLGLEHLYELTGGKSNELLFVFTNLEGKILYSHYKEFQIGGEEESYAIKVVKDYSGDGGQSFLTHLNWKFSTLDKQDAYGGCVKTYRAPWWYGPACFHVQLTYSEFHGFSQSLKDVKMMGRLGGTVLLVFTCNSPIRSSMASARA